MDIQMWGNCIQCVRVCASVLRIRPYKWLRMDITSCVWTNICHRDVRSQMVLLDHVSARKFKLRGDCISRSTVSFWIAALRHLLNKLLKWKSVDGGGRMEQLLIKNRKTSCLDQLRLFRDAFMLQLCSYKQWIYPGLGARVLLGWYVSIKLYKKLMTYCGVNAYLLGSTL